MDLSSNVKEKQLEKNVDIVNYKDRYLYQCFSAFSGNFINYYLIFIYAYFIITINGII